MSYTIKYNIIPSLPPPGSPSEVRLWPGTYRSLAGPAPPLDFQVKLEGSGTTTQLSRRMLRTTPTPTHPASRCAATCGHHQLREDSTKVGLTPIMPHYCVSVGSLQM